MVFAIVVCPVTAVVPVESLIRIEVLPAATDSALSDKVCFPCFASIRSSDTGEHQVPCYLGVFHCTICSTLCGVRIALVCFENMRFG